MTVSDPVIIAGIGLVQAVGIAWFTYHQSKMVALQAQMVEKIQQVETNTNSITSELMKKTASESHAAGMKDEKDSAIEKAALDKLPPQKT
jgi:hypothetical protein